MTRFKTIRICRFLALTICMSALPAHALLNESMMLPGETPTQGMTITFTPEGGDPVPGEITKDDEGRRIVAFVLPGDKPSAGVATITTADGSTDINVPQRDDDEIVVLDLATETATLASAAAYYAVASPAIGYQDNRWEFQLGIGASYIDTSYLGETLSNSNDELTALLEDNGVTGIGSRSSADDDTYGWQLDGTVAYRLTDRGSLYLTFAWGEGDDFEGDVRGNGRLQSSQINAGSDAESEFSYSGLTVGWEHRFRDCLRGYAGAGVMMADIEDSFTSWLSQDGTVIEEFSGSSKDSDEAAMIEAGLRYVFDTDGPVDLGLQLGMTWADEMFEDEDVFMLNGGIRVYF